MSVLDGIRIVVTRETGRSGGLPKMLRRQGAKVASCPAIETVPIRRPAGLGKILAGLGGSDPSGRPDWIVFTSAMGVTTFLSAVKGRIRGIRRRLGRIPIAAIGPGTAGAVFSSLGRRPAIVPRRYIAESLVRSLGNVRGKRIVIPRAAVARDVLPRQLRARGARVTVLKVYRTRACRAGLKALRRAIQRPANAVTFTSSSTVDFSMRAIGRRGRRLFAEGRVVAASIGPVTSASLRRWGIRPVVEADPHTLKSLASALVGYYRRSHA